MNNLIIWFNNKYYNLAKDNNNYNNNNNNFKMKMYRHLMYNN